MESRHELLHQSNGKDEDKEISPKGSTIICQLYQRVVVYKVLLVRVKKLW